MSTISYRHQEREQGGHTVAALLAATGFGGVLLLLLGGTAIYPAVIRRLA